MATIFDTKHRHSASCAPVAKSAIALLDWDKLQTGEIAMFVYVCLCVYIKSTSINIYIYMCVLYIYIYVCVCVRVWNPTEPYFDCFQGPHGLTSAWLQADDVVLHDDGIPDLDSFSRFSSIPNDGHLVGGWTNPFDKICASNWIISNL